MSLAKLTLLFTGTFHSSRALRSISAMSRDTCSDNSSTKDKPEDPTNDMHREVFEGSQRRIQAWAIARIHAI